MMIETNNATHTNNSTPTSEMSIEVKPITITASSSLVKAGPMACNMNAPMLSLKVNIKHLNLSKTLQFIPNTLVFDALKVIREKIPEINTDDCNMIVYDSSRPGVP